MESILKFLEFASIDPQMYWRIPGILDHDSYEIQWRREQTVRWRFRRFGEIFWQLGEDETLMSQLGKIGVDTEIFESQLRNSLLHQVCFADRIVADARAVLGEQSVDTAIQEHKAFIEAIEETVASLRETTRVTTTPHLKIIRD